MRRVGNCVALRVISVPANLEIDNLVAVFKPELFQTEATPGNSSKCLVDLTTQ